MSACCCQVQGTDKFFSKQAKRYARRFRRKGPDKASRHIVEGLKRCGIASKSVLDVGCGVGGVHLTLLQGGAASAEGVDVSQGMLDGARMLATEMGLEQKTHYRTGDFVEMNGKILAADILVLDKVICCYSDPVKLIRKSVIHTKSLLAVAYPKKSLLAWLVFQIPSTLGEVFRLSFHPYYHDPSFIERVFMEQKCAEAFSAETPLWQIRIYQKQSAGGAY